MPKSACVREEEEEDTVPVGRWSPCSSSRRRPTRALLVHVAQEQSPQRVAAGQWALPYGKCRLWAGCSTHRSNATLAETDGSTHYENGVASSPLRWENYTSFNLDTIAMRWSLPPDSTSNDGLGGGITYAVHAHFCDPAPCPSSPNETGSRTCSSPVRIWTAP